MIIWFSCPSLADIFDYRTRCADEINNRRGCSGCSCTVGERGYAGVTIDKYTHRRLRPYVIECHRAGG